MYAQIHAYVRSCGDICIHASAHAFTHSYLHSYIHTSTHPRIHTCIRMYACIHAFVKTSMRTHARARMRVRVSAKVCYGLYGSIRSGSVAWVPGNMLSPQARPLSRLTPVALAGMQGLGTTEDCPTMLCRTLNVRVMNTQRNVSHPDFPYRPFAQSPFGSKRRTAPLPAARTRSGGRTPWCA